MINLSSNIISLSKLPPAGLGNKLFSWAAGAVFAKINTCPHYITGLTRVHPGTYLRREKSKRFYRNYFVNERLILPPTSWLKNRYLLLQNDCKKIVDTSGVYTFSEIPHWSEHFHVLKEYREYIREYLFQTLHPNILKRLNKLEAPTIGVHIRMGDFRVAQSSTDFAKNGAVRTPIDYFSKMINNIRMTVGRELPVTLFSDGTPEELKELLMLPSVKLASQEPDIIDLLLLSRSSVIVMSAGSTFSFWAGFLSDGILINHYQHLHAAIRPDSHHNYEGGFSPEIPISSIPKLSNKLAFL